MRIEDIERVKHVADDGREFVRYEVGNLGFTYRAEAIAHINGTGKTLEERFRALPPMCELRKRGQ